MLGLLLKDLFNLKGQLKIIVLMTLIYGGVAISSHNIGIFSAMIAMIAIFLPISAAAYDERANWESYAMTMPIPRKALATSKYVLGFLGILSASLLYSTFALLFFKFPLTEVLLTVAGVSIAGFALQSLILPIIISIGVEKGRIAMMIVFLIPVGIGSLMKKANWLPSLDQLTGVHFSFIALAVFFLWLLSLKVSHFIYSKKNY